MLTDFLNNVSFFTWRNILFGCAIIFLNMGMNCQASQLKQPSITIQNTTQSIHFTFSSFSTDQTTEQTVDKNPIFMPHYIKKICPQNRESKPAIEETAWFLAFRSLNTNQDNQFGFLLSKQKTSQEELQFKKDTFQILPHIALTEPSDKPWYCHFYVESSNDLTFSHDPSAQIISISNNQPVASENIGYKYTVTPLLMSSFKESSLKISFTPNQNDQSKDATQSTIYAQKDESYTKYGYPYFTLNENGTIRFFDNDGYARTDEEIIELLDDKPTSSETTTGTHKIEAEESSDEITEQQWQSYGKRINYDKCAEEWFKKAGSEESSDKESSDEITEQPWQSFCKRMTYHKYAEEWFKKAGSFVVATFLMYLFEMYRPKTTAN